MNDTNIIDAIIVIAGKALGITILSMPMPQQASGEVLCEQKGRI
jgi:hypothetical protein